MIFLAPFLWLKKLFGPRRSDRTGGAMTFPDRELAAKRAAALMNMTLYLQRARNLGLKVRFLGTVRRDPYFVVPAGATGDILDCLSDPADNLYVIRVRLDDPVPGSEGFRGEVHWKESINLDDFEKDVAFFHPAR